MKVWIELERCEEFGGEMMLAQNVRGEGYIGKGSAAACYW
jgi:hypothetical protein